MNTSMIRSLPLCVLCLGLLLPAARAAAQADGAAFSMGQASADFIKNRANESTEEYKKAHRSDTEVMRDFGVQLLQDAPDEVRSGSSTKKAQYAFRKYCDKLNEGMVPVNAGYAGRALQLGTHLDGARWTCGDHAIKLAALFEGMGIAPEKMIQVQVGSPWYDTLSASSNHGVLTVLGDDGKPYCFDAWYLAVTAAATRPPDDWDHFTYTNTDPYFHLYNCGKFPEWNGMPAEEWAKRMKAAGYISFSADGGTTSFDTIAKALEGKFTPATDPNRLRPFAENYANGALRTRFTFYDGDYKPGMFWKGKTPGGKKYIIVHGNYQSYYGDGQKDSFYEFKDGVPDGKSQTWWPNGKEQSRGTYKQGKIVEGTWQVWDDSGKPGTSVTTGVYPWK